MWHLYFGFIKQHHNWNKWKCEREKQSLDSYLLEDYYDLNYNGRTKLSIFLIRYIDAQLDLTQVTTLKKKIWNSASELKRPVLDVNCEQWQAVLLEQCM